MEHYVTLFDSLFLPQGLALHMSMERHVSAYTLWILCMDDEVHDALIKLELPNVRILQLSQLETPELLAIKHTRTKGEYCWTLTPFAPRFVFEADSGVSRVTYLDADMWFRKNPAPIFREFDASGKDVLITDHAYASEHDQSATSGQYCVQFVTFARDGGEVVRKWWADRCIEWCFSRYEDGKFGDQKYLDDWPTRFADSVHVLSNKELTLAPWNATRFPYGNAITWHFHSLRISFNFRKSLLVIYGTYLLPKCTRENVYQYYVYDLHAAIERITNIGVTLKPQMTLSIVGYMRIRLLMYYQRLWIFNTNFETRL
ncbi:MAG: glycosyl transferase [Gallionellaceae bacterium]|jgi:hypothetical protein